MGVCQLLQGVLQDTKTCGEHLEIQVGESDGQDLQVGKGSYKYALYSNQPLSLYFRKRT